MTVYDVLYATDVCLCITPGRTRNGGLKLRERRLEEERKSEREREMTIEREKERGKESESEIERQREGKRKRETRTSKTKTSRPPVRRLHSKRIKSASIWQKGLHYTSPRLGCLWTSTLEGRNAHEAAAAVCCLLNHLIGPKARDQRNYEGIVMFAMWYMYANTMRYLCVFFFYRRDCPRTLI